MQFAELAVVLLLCLIAFLLLAVIVRYGVDSSKTSKRLADLVNEVKLLRAEINKLKAKEHIVDERV